MKFLQNLYRSSFEFIFLVAVMALTLSIVPVFYFFPWQVLSFEYIPLKSKSPALPILEVSLPLSSSFSALSFEAAQKQIVFFVDPPRPGFSASSPGLLIHLTQSKEIKRVEIPCRVDIEFDEFGQLRFSDKARGFFLHVQGLSENLIEASLSYQIGDVEEISQGSWKSTAQETLIQSVNDIPHGSPFRNLAESRWYGLDLFAEKYGQGEVVQRIEMGFAPNIGLIDFATADWIIFKGGKWQKMVSVGDAEGHSIAHIKQAGPSGLEMEGWDGVAHIRFRLPPSPLSPLKIRGEELFVQLRIRSEKQISCILDKQYVVLRPGNWVLKTDGRWKVLRSKEDQAAFLEGKMSGELFVLDRIDAKGSMKAIFGYYFSSGRSQMITIDYAPSVKNGVSNQKDRRIKK